MFGIRFPALWFVLISAILGRYGGPVAAQVCEPGWVPGPMTGTTPGTDGPIHAMITYGSPARLYVGGEFSHINGIAANNIAAWDGVQWSAVGGGCDAPVHAFTIYNSSLIVGGAFLSPGRRIAAWNGSSWAPVADIGPATADPDLAVRAMAVFQNQLYVGGRFCCVNGTGVLENCARFDGSLWYSAPGISNVVRALEVVDFDGAGEYPEELYIGGERFEGGVGGATFRYTQNGATWTDVNGPYGNVYALQFMPNGLGFGMPLLIVGGGFVDWVRPDGEHILARSIMRYAPSVLLPMGAGVTTAHSVTSLYELNGDLYVGGTFDTAGGLPADGFAKFAHVGNQWQAMGEFSQAGDWSARGVRAIQQYGSFLYAGGGFYAVDNNPGIVGVQNIARWSPVGWGSVGTKPRVRAAAALGNRLFVGGQFGHSVQETPTSPLINRNNILTWNGLQTGSLGAGTNGQVRSLLAYSTGGATPSNIVIAAGEFSTVYGDGLNPVAPIAANRIAQWVEPPFGLPAWSAMGAGFNNLVHSLTRFNGWIVAGGSFTASGATTTNRLAKYVGTPPSWQPLTSPDPGIDNSVFAMKAFSDELGGNNNYLVFGGAFTSAPPTGVAANRILMRVENPVAGQSSYQSLGQGFANGIVLAVERHGSGLNARTYAAGSFTMSGATTVNRIAVLNGANWQPVGNGGAGGGFNNVVYALRSHGGFLYAAGAFTSVDGIPANRVARWNGSTWSAVDFGADDEANMLAAFQNEVLLGGIFSTVDALGLVSPALARFSATGLPWIVQQPAADSAACGASADISVTLSPGHPNLTYQWRRDGVPIADGPTPAGTVIAGATTTALSITNAQPGDDGAFDCVITSPCGNVFSNAALFTITGTCAPLCPADIAPAPNGDNLVNVQDLLAVIGAWGACANPNDCRADIAPVGGDDLVNVQDLLAVIGAWGACP